MSEIIISTDIEADGPIPGPFSMLSLGCAAFIMDHNHRPAINLIDRFSVNLLQLAGATEDPETMKFWRQHPEA